MVIGEGLSEVGNMSRAQLCGFAQGHSPANIGIRAAIEERSMLLSRLTLPPLQGEAIVS